MSSRRATNPVLCTVRSTTERDNYPMRCWTPLADAQHPTHALCGCREKGATLVLLAPKMDHVETQYHWRCYPKLLRSAAPHTSAAALLHLLGLGVASTPGTRSLRP
jgi:hypothetical protein